MHESNATGSVVCLHRLRWAGAHRSRASDDRSLEKNEGFHNSGNRRSNEKQRLFVLVAHNSSCLHDHGNCRCSLHAPHTNRRRASRKCGWRVRCRQRRATERGRDRVSEVELGSRYFEPTHRPARSGTLRGAQPPRDVLRQGGDGTRYRKQPPRVDALIPGLRVQRVHCERRRQRRECFATGNLFTPKKKRW